MFERTLKLSKLEKKTEVSKRETKEKTATKEKTTTKETTAEKDRRKLMGFDCFADMDEESIKKLTESIIAQVLCNHVISM